MVRLAILDQDGKHLTPQDVPTAKELLTLVEQARSVIRDCERLAQQMGAKSGASQPQQIPYMS
jgi:cob(I)alamin adenosyltransferase